MHLKHAIWLAFTVSFAALAPTVSLAEDSGNFTPLYINVGGGEIQWNGTDWVADSHFQSGQALEDSTATPSGVQQAFTGSVYASQRWDFGSIEYTIPVPPGAYDIELHFAELWHPEGSVGRRVFDVEVEGVRIAEAVDVVARTNGDINTSVVIVAEAVDPSASGAQDLLEVRINTRTDASILNALVLACADGATCAPVSAGQTEEPEGDAGPILSAVNLGGKAMDYGDIAFAADDGVATGQTGEEVAGGNGGPNGTQMDLVGTPFASVRWGPEVSYSVAAPTGTSTLDRYFMEGWWPDAGRRVMAIEIEGQIVRDDFDIVHASGGDFNTPQVLRFKGIDPTVSGDPNRIEFRVIARRDNTVLSAVVLRCEDTAEACEAGMAEAEAERIRTAVQIVDADQELEAKTNSLVSVPLANLRKEDKYWLTLVKPTVPVGDWSDYHDISGAVNFRRVPTPAEPGLYELRLHRYQAGDDPLMSVRKIRVLTQAQIELAATVAKRNQIKNFAPDLEAEAAFSPEHWIGIWEHYRTIASVIMETGQRVNAPYRSVLIVKPDSVVMQVPFGSLLRCDTRLMAGAAPSEMTVDIEYCPGAAVRDITNITDPILSATPDGNLRMTRLFNGEPIDFTFRKLRPLDYAPASAPADAPLETGGISLPATVKGLKAQIEDAYPLKSGISGLFGSGDPWRVETVSPGDVEKLEIAENKEVYRFSYYPGDDYVDAVRADGSNVFTFFALSEDPQADVLAVLRRWRPERDNMPTIGTTAQALEQKYGVPTKKTTKFVPKGWFVTNEAFTARNGAIWEFNADGTRRDKLCDGPMMSDLTPEPRDRMYHPKYDLTDTIPLRAQCGFSIKAEYQVVPGMSDTKPIITLHMTLTDHTALEKASHANLLAASDSIVNYLEERRPSDIPPEPVVAVPEEEPDPEPVVQPDL